MFECLSGLGVTRRRRAGETRQVMSREKPDEGEPEAGADSRTHDPMESGEAKKENKCLRWSERRSCGAGEIESAKGNGERLSGDEVIECLRIIIPANPRSGGFQREKELEHHHMHEGPSKPDPDPDPDLSLLNNKATTQQGAVPPPVKAPAESSSEDLNVGGGKGLMLVPSSKKRFRTKFTQQQKQQMHEFAKKIGWRIQKQYDQEVHKFCSEVGVKRQVFTV
nr:zinc-finger homeodomain protein 6-like [Ipomoea batatas]